MITRRASVLGLVSLLALTAGCEIDRPPALREAFAGEPPGEASLGVAQVVTAVPSAFGSGARTAESIDTPTVAPDAPSLDAPAAAAAVAAVAEPRGSDTAQGPVPTGQDATTDPDAEGARRPVRFPRPGAVRGLYANAWAAGSASRMDELLGIARRTEINALVIDIKDASGYVSHRTEVPLAHEIGATGELRIRDLPALLDRLEREGVYPIARIVIVRDPILAEFRPELAVNDTAGGVWVDSKGLTWMNPYASAMWDYPIALAREVALLGFPEIQFDYVRFPDAPEDDMARAAFLGADGRAKPTVIRDFLQRARAELEDLDVQLTADVFGVTTSARRDVGIGQVWEAFIDQVDVALPMVYPSHYWEGSFGFSVPNAHPYEVVGHALRDAVGRSTQIEGAGRTRPWLQDFSLGQPPYTAAEVRAQIQATYDAGIDEWILWNPGSRYTEAALQPEGGFEREPYIRLADRLVPASERWAVLDSVAAARRLADARAQAAAAAAATPAEAPKVAPPAPVEATDADRPAAPSN